MVVVVVDIVVKARTTKVKKEQPVSGLTRGRWEQMASEKPCLR